MSPLVFSANAWPAAAIAVAGLGLTGLLYGRAALPISPGWKRTLAGLSAAAWIALAFFLAQPAWKLNPEIFHRPAVVLAVDESASYAALGARAASAASLEAARAHYDSLGFDVRLLGFADRVGDTKARAPRAGAFGPGTRASALVRALDSLALPNLQAVLLWSDGRFEADADGAGEDWPAPVFPVRVPASAEAQGEKVVVEASDPAEATVAVTWRGADEARLELRAAGKTVWTQRVTRPRGAEPGTAVTTELKLPVDLARTIEGSGVLQALVKSVSASSKSFLKNDTVETRLAGTRRAREIFLRPLTTLDERGLVDALSSDSTEVTAELPGDPAVSVALRAGAVMWVRAGRGTASAVKTVGARVDYLLPEDAEGFESFDAEARVSWREEGAAFLPAEVLRLADLGVESGRSLRLRSPAPRLEALAWAEHEGRNGLLVWRDRTTGAFGFAVPPIWRAAFQAAPAARETRALQARWARGVATWVRGPRAVSSAARARDPNDVEMSLLGVNQELLARAAAASGGRILEASQDGSPFAWPVLRGGQTRESRFRAAELAPAWPSVLVISLLLCALWALRKRLRLD
jgi:hypothetical protein